MQSVRCDACSLVNFTTSSACKRCGSALGSIEGNESHPQQLVEADTRWSQSYNASSSGVGGQYQRDYFADSPANRGAGKGKPVGIILVALVCLVAAVGVPWYLKSGKSELADISWRPFTSSNGDFSILMPQEPKLKSSSQTTPAGTVRSEMYFLQTEGKTAFAVGSIKYPATQQIAPDQMFDRSSDSMTGRSGAMVLSRKNITLDGYEGREYEIKPPVSANLPNDKGVVRVYWVAPTFYIVMVGGPDSPEAAAARTKYLDSFKLNTRH